MLLFFKLSFCDLEMYVALCLIILGTCRSGFLQCIYLLSLEASSVFPVNQEWGCHSTPPPCSSTLCLPGMMPEWEGTVGHNHDRYHLRFPHLLDGTPEVLVRGRLSVKAKQKNKKTHHLQKNLNNTLSFYLEKFQRWNNTYHLQNIFELDLFLILNTT